jgi:divalent metal cation (Fe/Co/Zn/Cd) transporter
MFGHEKAEFFSAGAEGALILVVSAGIAWLAVGRLIHPVVLEDVAVGIAVSVALVPGSWTIKQGHDLSERLERELRSVVPHASVLTHLEPVEDPASFDDEQLDRERT